MMRELNLNVINNLAACLHSTLLLVDGLIIEGQRRECNKLMLKPFEMLQSFGKDWVDCEFGADMMFVGTPWVVFKFHICHKHHQPLRIYYQFSLRENETVYEVDLREVDSAILVGAVEEVFEKFLKSKYHVNGHTFVFRKEDTLSLSESFVREVRRA